MSLSRRLEARLRFRHMRMLIEIERCGSVREAARAISVTQPALSKSLADLERTLGAQLYLRTARGLVPTPEGVVATRWATSILNELQAMAEQTEAVAGDMKLLLRVGTVPFLSDTLLPISLADMRDAGTSLRVRHIEGRVPDLLAQLAAGLLDVVMTPYTPRMRMGAQASRLVYDDLYTETLSLFAATTHPLARAPRPTWCDVDPHEWVLSAPPSLLREVFDDELAKQAMGPPIPVIESTTIAAIIAGVQQGLGIGVAPLTALRPGIRAGRLARLKLPDDMRLPVALIHRDTTQGQPPIEIFRRSVHAALARFSSRFGRADKP